MQVRGNALRGLLMAGVAFGATGCDEGGSSSEDADAGAGAQTSDAGGNGGETDSGPNSDDAGAADPDPVYALVTQVFGASGDENVSYVVLTDDLSKGELDPADAAASVPGRAIGFGPNEDGHLFVGGDTAPPSGGSAATIQRWDLESDGTLTKFDAQLSFANLGVSTIGEYGGQFVFASEEKAYYFDGTNAQVVVWNPDAMTLVDDLSLEELVIDGTLLTFSPRPVIDGTTVYTFAGWRTMTAIPSRAAVVMLDTETDDVQIITDDRCGYVRDGVLADDGFLYMATENYASAVHRLNEDNAPAPCLLRFDPATAEFDPDFHVELADLFDGASAGSLLAGPDGTVFIEVLDEGVVFIDESTHPRVLASMAGAWQWAELTLGDEPKGEILDVAPGNGSIVPQLLGNDVFIPQFEGGGSDPYSTAMRPVRASGPRALGATTPGLVFSAVKLR